MSDKPSKPKRASAVSPERLHRAVAKKLSRMSTEQIFQSAVKAGIYTRQGKLKKPYAPTLTNKR